MGFLLVTSYQVDVAVHNGQGGDDTVQRVARHDEKAIARPLHSLASRTPPAWRDRVRHGCSAHDERWL